MICPGGRCRMSRAKLREESTGLQVSTGDRRAHDADRAQDESGAGNGKGSSQVSKGSEGEILHVPKRKFIGVGVWDECGGNVAWRRNMASGDQYEEATQARRTCNQA